MLGFRRSLQLLIDASRRETENEEFSDTIGIGNEEFIRYANDAQKVLQSAISGVYPMLLSQEKIISSVVDQEAYDIPDNAFLGNRIDNVEYSPSGRDDQYRKLKQGTLSERRSGISSTPSFYIRRSGQILLQPKPDTSQGKIRLTYQKQLPRLEIVRGYVSAVTLDSVNNQITSLTLDSTQSIDKVELEQETQLTVIDKNGVQKMRNVQFDEVDETTGIVTITSGFTYEDGETIAVGDSIVRGGDSTTHSELPEMCEPFITAYMNWKILKRDSSNDAVEMGQEVAALKAEIVQSFSTTDHDPDFIPILDDQFLTPFDEF